MSQYIQPEPSITAPLARQSNFIPVLVGWTDWGGPFMPASRLPRYNVTSFELSQQTFYLKIYEVHVQLKKRLRVGYFQATFRYLLFSATSRARFSQQGPPLPCGYLKLASDHAQNPMNLVMQNHKISSRVNQINFKCFFENPASRQEPPSCWIKNDSIEV